MTDVPAIGTTVVPGGDRPALRRQLTKIGERVFDSAEVRDLYLSTFANLVLELEQVPGYGLSMEMLAERFAFFWAAQKNFDNLDQPVSALEYEKLAQRFMQVFDRLLKARDERQADEAFKRQFIALCMSAIVDGIEAAEPDLGRQQVIQQSIIGRLRLMVEGPAQVRGG